VLRDGEESSREQGQVKKHFVMVGSCPCMVLSEVHINGCGVSEPVQEDKGKVMVSESENDKGPKRARMVLSKGRKVVGPGYSRPSGDAARVADIREESRNHNRVDRARRGYNTDRRIDQVTQDSRGN
jgi:hypothetical protein